MAYVGIKAGSLRDSVTIQNWLETQSEDGETVRTWPDEDAYRQDVWAKVEPISHRSMERLAGSQLQQEVTHFVTLRYVSGLTTKHRIGFGDRVLEIIAVVNIEERNRVHELWCKEVVES